MAPVNPYLCKKPTKQEPNASSLHPLPLAAPTHHATNDDDNALKSHTMMVATVAKPKQANSGALPKPRPTPPSSTCIVQQQKPFDASTPKAASSCSKEVLPSPIIVSTAKTKSKMSFKSKLKQEIELLKRAKQLEQQRKLQQIRANKLRGISAQQQQEQQQQRKEQGLYQSATTTPSTTRHSQHTTSTNHVTPVKSTTTKKSANVPQSQSNPSLGDVQKVTPSSAAVASSSHFLSNVDTNSLSNVHAYSNFLKTRAVTSSVAAAQDKQSLAPNNTTSTSLVDTPTTLHHSTHDGNVAVEAFVSAEPPVTTHHHPMAMVEHGPPLQADTLAFHPSMYPNFEIDHALKNMRNGASAAALLRAPPYYYMTTAMPTNAIHAGWNPNHHHHPTYDPIRNPTWMQPPPSPALPPPTIIPVRAIHTNNTPAAKKVTAAIANLNTTGILHHEPLNPSSPYSTTHTLLEHQVFIYKRIGESFGVTLQYEAQSTTTLVEQQPEIAKRMMSSSPDDELVVSTTNGKFIRKKKQTSIKQQEMSDFVNDKVTTTTCSIMVGTTLNEKESILPNVPDTISKGDLSVSSANVVTGAGIRRDETQKRRPPRRRRVLSVGVLKVVHADNTQNAQFQEVKHVSNGSMVLKSGDIILKVNGRDVGGLTFQQAIALFASCDTTFDSTAAQTDDAAATCNSSESNSSITRQSLICCPLMVARKNKSGPLLDDGRLAQGASNVAPVRDEQPLPVPRSVRIPFVLNAITHSIHSRDFSNTEVLALARGAWRCITAESRALGNLPSSHHLELACLESPALNQRDIISSIQAKLNHTFRSIEQSSKELATAHWTNQWKIEQEKAHRVSDLQQLPHPLSDAQRSAMRALPRPAKGCRCGRMDHEYVNDSSCVLYRNLRVLSETKVSPDRNNSERNKMKLGNLNAVETAYKDRILKLKAEAEREKEEARFVEEMEELQVKQLKRAVFAPNLTAMVLSAVCELAKDISIDEDSIDKDFRDTITLDKIKPETQSVVSSNSPKNHVGDVIKSSSSSQTQKDILNVDNDEDDESDEDDDVPLASLCKKRDAPSTQESDSKRQKVQAGASTAEITFDTKPYATKERPSLNLSFLARILRHCSLTWGHLYKEPTDAEYAWRWEVYHGQTSSAADAHQDSQRRNPRQVDSLSLENIRFALNDDVIARLSAATTTNDDSLETDETSLEASNDMLVLSCLFSPKSTGVYDEIMALLTMGVLRRTISGCVVLAKDWAMHVDPLLLNDMEEHWCKRLDPRNKHCISRPVRTKLESEWTRVRRGWAMSSDLDDIVYSDEEWNEWKEHFQDRFESQINDTEGIEKFGI